MSCRKAVGEHYSFFVYIAVFICLFLLCFPESGPQMKMAHDNGGLQSIVILSVRTLPGAGVTNLACEIILLLYLQIISVKTILYSN